MPINWTPVEEALRAWAVDGTGLTDDQVVWANQDGPRPDTPFVALNRKIELKTLGAYPERRLDPDAPGIITHVRQCTFPFHLDAYGPNANGLLEAVREALDLMTTRDDLAAVGLAVLDSGHVYDLTTLVDGSYEERAQLEVNFGIASTTTEDVGWIETAEVSLTLPPDGASADPITLTITT